MARRRSVAPPVAAAAICAGLLLVALAAIGPWVASSALAVLAGAALLELDRRVG